MLYDCHLHMHTDHEVPYDDLPERMKSAGVDGAILISDSPDSYGERSKRFSSRFRIEKLMEVASSARASGADLYPFYWIDPLEHDALEQVDACVAQGVAGFKAICCQYAPSHPRAMQLWSYIATKRKPILFHSGIQYDRSASGKNNRPIEFEPLLFIPGLTFALAHIAWPWCDELVSMLGKWTCVMKKQAPDRYANFFIDTTPGTPALYREDALRKILTIYEFSDNIMFGTDNAANPYDTEQVKRYLEMDARALQNISGVTKPMLESLYAGALLRFMGARR